MEFPLERREPKHKEHEHEVLRIVHEFTKGIHKELGSLLRAVVLFGSAAKPETENPHDIDVLVIVDDIHINFTREVQTAYHIITENAVRATSSRLHITTLRFSNFWEHVRTSDPVIITVLRDGLPIIDTGFFTPIQLLLQQGRIRPTPEAIWNYYSQAPQLLTASKWKIMLGIVDLYWAVINSAHAALMAAGVTPHTPEHVPGLLRSHFVEKGLLDDKYADVCERFYHLQKDIYSRHIDHISGARFEVLHKQAADFVKAMREFLVE